MTPDLANIRAGDHLLYGPSDFFGWATCVKTFSPYCHIEIYIGGCQSVASRNGIGVNQYPLRLANLTCVRRPMKPMNLAKGLAWFRTVQGQKYDWLGLLCFTLAVKQGSPNKMFCSELALRFDRHCEFEPFNPAADADHTAPAQFWQSAELNTIWEA